MQHVQRKYQLLAQIAKISPSKLKGNLTVSVRGGETLLAKGDHHPTERLPEAPR